MTQRELRQALRRAGGEDPGARERAWEVVRAAYAGHVPVRRRPPWALGLLAAAALAVGGVGAATASSPDSGVGGWVRDVLGVDGGGARPDLGSLPGGGRVLAQAGGSAWVVSSDGSRRRLGSYAGASWSPRGRFVVAWRRGTLAALQPDGGVRWSLTRPERIAAARWGPVDGFRVAYVAGRELRIVNGDGTRDRRLAATLPGVAPAWQPRRGRVVAFPDAAGRVRAVHVDTERVLWRTLSLRRPRTLAWSAGGSRLLLLTGDRLVLLSAGGRELVNRRVPSGTALEDPVCPPGRTPRRGGAARRCDGAQRGGAPGPGRAPAADGPLRGPRPVRHPRLVAGRHAAPRALAGSRPVALPAPGRRSRDRDHRDRLAVLTRGVGAAVRGVGGVVLLGATNAVRPDTPIATRGARARACLRKGLRFTRGPGRDPGARHSTCASPSLRRHRHRAGRDRGRGR